MCVCVCVCVLGVLCPHQVSVQQAGAVAVLQTAQDLIHEEAMVVLPVIGHSHQQHTQMGE